MAKKLLLTLVASSISLQSTLAAVPSQALTFSSNVQIFNATADMTTKIESAEQLIKSVIATDAFRDRVINHSYNGVRTYVDNGGLTNEQIYQKILDGVEVLNGVKDNEMDLEIEMYYTYNSTVGYTYPDDPRIYANTKFYNSYTPVAITANMIHEWLHKLGFKHATSYSTSRDYSVPYAVGTIMRELAATVNTNQFFTAPTNLAVRNTASNLTLSWSPATSSNGIESYKIYRKLAGSTSTYLQGTVSSLTYSQTKPTSNATYYVKALDRAGKTLNSATVEYVKLTAVSNLALTTTSTNVNLSWSAAKASAGIKEYRVYRRLATGTATYIQSTTTALNFTQPKPSSSAYYYVRAVDTNGATVKSLEVKYTR